MPKALLDGISLYYHRRPGTPVLVMVHGLATNSAFWYLKILPLLRGRFGVLLFDLRGHGQSDMPPTGYTTADMARDLHALLDHLCIEHAHLVGHSYGGTVALHYAVFHPERVVSLTLADAYVQCLQPGQRIPEGPLAAEWQKELEALNVPVEETPGLGYRVLEALAESHQRGNLYGRKLGGFSPFALSRGRNRTAAQWLQLLRTTSAKDDFTQVAGLTVERIRGVTHPTLAIFGEYSFCLPSCEGLQKHLPNCRAVIVPRAGHFHPMVRPFFFARALQGFLRGVC
ncbi:MAG: alpha/beta hydrolase [Thermodesulfobacteriota bacterium]|jgi:pimeloyl-ACP methyl ester carboxylesterase